MNTAQNPVRIGLVGAGQWAETMHAPLHSAGAETQLTGVWARRPAAAQELARKHGVPAFSTFEELLENSEAVDFAVPPDIQADLAIGAAEAGRAVMLEKPLATTFAQAAAISAAVERYQVPNILILSKRYHPRTRDFLTEAQAWVAGGEIAGLRGRYIHGGFLESGFLGSGERQGWRQAYGALYDLGPHLLDLMDAAAGPISAVSASGQHGGYTAFTTFHTGGSIGQAAVSGNVAVERVATDIDLYSPAGQLTYSTSGMDQAEAWPILRAEFASAVRSGSPVTADIARGLHIQRILEALDLSVTQGRTVELTEIAIPSAV
ncbi:MAG TPA: Gfo/Idh/MocA family oxidoreductase [Glaciibacter sp.]|nr:Gfo/Idh/MocA family oxidoreductase [Glaciibacter sp.]